MENSEIKTLIKTLTSMKAGGQFAPFIDYIVFPKYRRMATDERISFTFPLTVLVGQNGSGKSSVLQALAGAPEGYSVGAYWFSTTVDPIDKPTTSGSKVQLADSQRARFWYGYTENNEEKQAIKQRVRKADDPDYWEPTRFAKKYGMTKKPTNGKDRHDQIKMHAEYLSLRLYLSAFDKCFHFLGIKTLNQFQNSKAWKHIVEKNSQAKGKSEGKTRLRQKAQRRDYIRHRSKRLNSAMSSTKETFIATNKVANTPEVLTPAILTIVSDIVGKKYISGLLVTHRLYESWGESVRFVTESGQYSEANAGSGETAVVMIVRLFEKAKPHSLVLLDEPETSLHPGAQIKLLKYILIQIKHKKLQVVLSTHAPTFVRHLPIGALKILKPSVDGYVKVIENVHSEDAFHEIGQEFDPNCNIVVEDKLAKSLLDSIASKQGSAFSSRVHIQYGPGGDTAMKQDIAVYLKDINKSPIVIFDGDKMTSHQDPQKLTLEEITVSNLDEVIKRQTGRKIDFNQNSNMSDELKELQRLSYLRYYHKRVFYLPFSSPDEAIWSDEAAKAQLQAMCHADSVGQTMAKIASESNYKKKFAILANMLGGGDVQLSSLHAMFVKRFVDTETAKVDEVVKVLNDALAAAEMKNA